MSRIGSDVNRRIPHGGSVRLALRGVVRVFHGECKAVVGDPLPVEQPPPVGVDDIGLVAVSDRDIGVLILSLKGEAPLADVLAVAHVEVGVPASVLAGGLFGTGILIGASGGIAFFIVRAARVVGEPVASRLKREP